MLKMFLVAVTGYLIGSLNIAIIISKLFFKSDVRNSGSGNAGATNVARTFGWAAGIATFVFDFGKMVLAARIGKEFGSDLGMCLAGLGCVFGHCFPVYFGFKGGFQKQFPNL